MRDAARRSKVVVWLREVRGPFFTASVIPVVVGTAAAYAATGRVDWTLFALALVAVVLLHAGANVANDYFDHVSGADARNPRPTPFSGGSRVIQEGLLSPREVLIGACVLFAAGTAVGLLVVRDLVLLAFVVAGLLLGWGYTAPPLRLGYRAAGEVAVALAFGVLPVTGAFYLQTASVTVWVVLAGALVGMLIFDVLLANEFPDESADRAAGKRTLVVVLGRRRAGWVYRVVLLAAYLLAGLSMVAYPQLQHACVMFLLTLPVGALALHLSGPDLVFASGRYHANLVTMLLHFTAGAMLSAGFVMTGLRGACGL